MTEEEIRKKIEIIDPDNEIPVDTVEELIRIMTEIKGEEEVKEDADIIRQQLNDEVDWRKRASLAAKLVSMNLD